MRLPTYTRLGYSKHSKLMGTNDNPLQNVVRDTQRLFEIFSRIINGSISFGNATFLSTTTGSKDPSQNLDHVWISAVFTVANTNLTLNHNLGRIPVGYFPVQKAAACDVYDGTVAKTTTQITLKGTVATTVTLLIF